MKIDRKKLSQLSEQEEQLYFTLRDVSEFARSRLITSNIRIVLHLIDKHFFPGYPPEDQLMDGVEALIWAVDCYDYGKGNKFLTYAYKVINSSLLNVYYNDYVTMMSHETNAGENDQYEQFIGGKTFGKQEHAALIDQTKKIIDTLPKELSSSVNKRFFSGDCLKVYGNDWKYYRRMKRGLQMVKDKANIILPLTLVELRESVNNNPALLDVFADGEVAAIVCSKCSKTGMTFDKAVRRISGGNGRAKTKIYCVNCKTNFFI